MIDWSKVLTNAVSLLVASVFVGAAALVWRGVQGIDGRIEESVSEIRVTQQVIAPKVDGLEAKMNELVDQVNKIVKAVPEAHPERPVKPVVRLERDPSFSTEQMIRERIETRRRPVAGR